MNFMLSIRVNHSLLIFAILCKAMSLQVSSLFQRTPYQNSERFLAQLILTLLDRKPHPQFVLYLEQMVKEMPVTEVQMSQTTKENPNSFSQKLSHLLLLSIIVLPVLSSHILFRRVVLVKLLT